MNMPTPTLPKMLRFSIFEALAIVIIVLVSFHLVSERINHAEFPGGDQGSWMGVAAQVCRGEGFTTRWLEYPFLHRATLPRPDDFRYPGLVYPLALSFKAFGISYKTGLWTASAIFFVFIIAVFLVCRKAFNPPTALISMAMTSVSLLQLQWNTIVYSEGLFGLMIAGLIFWCIANQTKNKNLFWIVLGAGCGLVYCVRPNGILFGAGILWLYWTERKKGSTISMLALGLASMAAVMLPWLIRTWYWFGNPFHIATNAALFRGGLSDRIDLTFSQFVSNYGLFYPLKATIIGIGNFSATLHFFEHGLEILPLLGVAIGLVARRGFFSPFVSASFLFSIIACCYASRIGGAWAGVRYFSPFLPFVYAYGIFALVSILARLTERKRRVWGAIAVALMVILLFTPVFYPHKYYERTFRSKPPSDLTFKDHTQALGRLLGPKGAYFAISMAQLNFLYDYRCVGLQKFVDSSYIKELVENFSPKLLVVTQQEFQDPRMGPILREIRRQGGELTLAESNKYGLYWRIGADKTDLPSATRTSYPPQMKYLTID
jgi:hypothetical protein